MINKEAIVQALHELSDEEFQRKVWMEASSAGTMSSFSEAVCSLFDDSGLGDALDKTPKRQVLAADVDERLRTLAGDISRFSHLEGSLPIETLISHPQMNRIRVAARDILQKLT